MRLAYQARLSCSLASQSSVASTADRCSDHEHAGDPRPNSSPSEWAACAG